jgi:putative transposase
MPRSKRIVIPGMPHHIVQRGNHRMNVFLDDNDRLVFLRLLGEASAQHGLINLGYNLMTNHEHVVSIPKEESSLARTMRDLLGPYASYFNRKYGLNGRLWQGRYYSTVLDDEHFWAALRYVELNPVRAGIVLWAEQYPWSSAPAHCGLVEEPLLSPLPPGVASIGDWSEWLRAGDSKGQVKLIRECTKTGRPCGNEYYLKELELRTGKILTRRKSVRASTRPAENASKDQNSERIQRNLFAFDEKNRR